MQGSFHAARFLVVCFHLPEARHLRFKHFPGSAQELVQMLAQVVVHGAKELPLWLPLIPVLVRKLPLFSARAVASAPSKAREKSEAMVPLLLPFGAKMCKSWSHANCLQPFLPNNPQLFS